LHGESCGRRIERWLFECKKLNKVFNADLVGAYNILITPSPADRGNWPETWPGIEPLRRYVIPKLPAFSWNRHLGWGGGQRPRIPIKKQSGKKYISPPDCIGKVIT